MNFDHLELLFVEYVGMPLRSNLLCGHNLINARQQLLFFMRLHSGDLFHKVAMNLEELLLRVVGLTGWVPRRWTANQVAHALCRLHRFRLHFRRPLAAFGHATGGTSAELLLQPERRARSLKSLLAETSITDYKLICVAFSV